MPSAPHHPIPKADPQPSNPEADERDDTHLTVKSHPRAVPMAVAPKADSAQPGCGDHRRYNRGLRLDDTESGNDG